jgi:hypothetical protein
VGILLFLHICVNIVRFNYYINNGLWSNNDYVKVLINLFDFNTEKNIPTFYSALALLFSSILLFLIAIYNKKYNLKYYSWILLSIVFLFLSFDEILELHEHFVRLTQRLLSLSGFGTAYWTIPYLIATIILFLSLVRFLKELPIRTLKLFVLAGIIFIAGSVGMEIFGGRVEEIIGRQNIAYVFLYTIEEILEKIGVIIFIYALTSYKSISIKMD